MRQDEEWLLDRVAERASRPSASGTARGPAAPTVRSVYDILVARL